MSIKSKVLWLLKNLPENSSFDDIMEKLYVNQKILKGQSQLEKGQFYSHERAKKIIAKF